jgi:hypothetical protein
MKDNNYKLAITIGYFALVVVGMAGITLIVLFRPDATASMIQTVVMILGLASTATVTFYMLGKVITNTNGANTALRDTIAEKDQVIASQQHQLLSVVSQAPPAP